MAAHDDTGLCPFCVYIHACDEEDWHVALVYGDEGVDATGVSEFKHTSFEGFVHGDVASLSLWVLVKNRNEVGIAYLFCFA